MSLPFARVLVVVLATCLQTVAASAFAQLQQGTIRGIVLGPDGQPAAAAVIRLLDALGAPLQSAVVEDGSFLFRNVAPGTYTLRADAPPLHAVLQRLTVTTAVPVRVELRLSALAAEQVVVHGRDAEPVSTATRVTISGEAVRRAPSRLRSRGVQDALAAVAGWASEDNGLLHVRGVDDGFLYVIDGIPVYERIDALFGMAPDPAMIESLNVVTGYVPPEFGWKSGGVIEVRSAARTASEWAGTVDVGAGTEAARDLSAVAGGPAGRAASLTAGLSRHSSERFLDPVHPDNLHNEGHAWNGGAQLGWSASPRDQIALVWGAARSRFDVPHSEEQEEAGQDQRQRIGQGWISASWQRGWAGSTVSQVSGFHRAGTSRLAGSEWDTPLFTDADRTLHRTGLLASLAHQRGRHLMKFGGEASWLRLREDFVFAVTDGDAAEEVELSDAALAFTREDPFRFSGAARPSLFSVYAQDSIRVAPAVTIDAGVRADWSRLLARAFQLSPRLGAAYDLRRSGTTVRASFARFLQPPQPENLLLASSEQAWALSPFRVETGGGAALQPERQTAIELGVDQQIAGALRLDVALWRRTMTHVADPNVLFGTTILFPNSVAEGDASGVDVRIEVPRRRGWSGYLRYANGRVVQTGPITGGLFLEDEIIEIGPGVRFTPDHDQRYVGSFGVSYDADRPGFWISVTGRYESGTPLEVEEDDYDELRARPGAALVDFDRGRVKARTVLDAAASLRVARGDAVEVSVRAALLNLTGRRWAYNFGNPFSGTHFGPGRTLQIGARLTFR